MPAAQVCSHLAMQMQRIITQVYKNVYTRCLLPLWRVHEIKRMFLDSRTHGLFIT